MRDFLANSTDGQQVPRTYLALQFSRWLFLGVCGVVTFRPFDVRQLAVSL